MAISRRQWGLFAAGLVLGGAGVALLLQHDDTTEQAKAPASAPSAVVLGAPPAAAASAAAAPAVTAEHLAACEAQPLLRASGASDGQLALPEETAGKSVDVAEKSLVAGKEVAAAGRPRDAEVAFLVACRIAAEAQQPLTLAEAKYNLARHYAQAASEPAGQAQGEVLRERARSLYTAAHALFGKELGAAHEKTRFAANGLQALAVMSADVVRAPPLQPQAQRNEAPTRPGTKEAGESEPARNEATVAKAAPAPKPARRSAPSFDCAKARSAAEKAICADEELARADRELGRLHARAKAQSADSRAFQQRSDEAWRWREANCRGDRECLRQWYEQRRQELEEAAEEADDGSRP